MPKQEARFPMTVITKSFSANSLEQHWLPFTANREFKHEPRLLVKGEGVYYWNNRGDKLIDASAGLFCAAAGHCRKEIADAVSAQLRQVDFTPHFQVANPLSFELARKVAALTPGDLDYVFFTNSGSEANDTILRMARRYWDLMGQPKRTVVISRLNAYHG
ncbi:MAG: aminotransferase class III-fold pyridoxal phosphate-dependent enzyme, partial [Terriglobales bacterium]